MTTLKPQLVRADTLDLQAVDSPSAQDHTRQPTRTGYGYGNGSIAPHQAQTLRRAEKEAHQQQGHSPRLSGTFENGTDHRSQPYDDPDDGYEDDHHGLNGTYGHDDDYDELDGTSMQEDDLDEDMMDKISSSPSIEDGKYSRFLWPQRMDSIGCCPSSLPSRGISQDTLFETSPTKLHIRNTGACSATPVILKIRTRSPEKNPYSETCTSNGQEYKVLDRETEQENEGAFKDHDEGIVLDGENEHDLFHDSSSDNFSDDAHFDPDSRFIDSGWGGECLREADDIDLDFVYALHTFVATVEGQANAAKGDTMVLLDDSNSYWWLVRITKDGSIGYLPAEHIETPTERLARFNKHRNIDLSQSMLGDSAEKSKNPLNKARRRRKAKTVQFSAPTYYEPSDYEYSDEEEVDENPFDHPNDDDNQTDELEDEPDQRNGGVHGDDDIIEDVRADPIVQPQSSPQKQLIEDPRKSTGTISPIKPQTIQTVASSSPVDESGAKVRKSPSRTTDPFLQDDNLETKKISLTPRLLRGDTENTNPVEQESRSTSLDTFDKVSGAEDKSKDDKKKKEKKGVFSFLKRRDKDKGSKGSKTDIEEVEKISEDATRSPEKSSPEEIMHRSEIVSPDRRPSKLQKKSPGSLAQKSSPDSDNKPSRIETSTVNSNSQLASSSLQDVLSNSGNTDDNLSSIDKSNQSNTTATQPSTQLASPFSSQADKRSLQIQTLANSKDPPPVYADRHPNQEQQQQHSSQPLADDTRHHVGLGQSNHTLADMHRQLAGSVSPIDDAFGDHIRSDSAVQVSPIEPSRHSGLFGRQMATTGLAINTGMKHHEDDHGSSSSEEATEVTPVENELTSTTSKDTPSTATQSPSTARSTPTWSDASLRTYMENSQDIKDLLIIVHDRSNVTPVGADHPLMSNLFVRERSKVNEMQSQLDMMLMSWMSKKNPGLS